MTLDSRGPSGEPGKIGLWGCWRIALFFGKVVAAATFVFRVPILVLVWRSINVGYIEKNLVPGEKVLYKTRLHWIVLLKPLLLGLVLAAGGLALLIGDYYTRVEGVQHQAMLIGGIALLALGGIVIAGGLIRRNATEVAVSNQRVLIKTGMYARKSIEVMLAKVESIGVEEPTLGRMLGYGSVIIRGTGGTYETFHLISHPNEFRRQVQQQIGLPA